VLSFLYRELKELWELMDLRGEFRCSGFSERPGTIPQLAASGYQLADRCADTREELFPMRYSLYIIAGVLLALVVACGSQAPTGAAPLPTQAAATTQPPTATTGPAPTPTQAAAPTRPPAPATATPAGADQPAGDPQDVVVVFGRSGGIAGLSQTMTVYADGRIAFSDDVAHDSAQAAPADLARLRQLLASPEFAALDARYPAMGADLFVYEISVMGAGRAQKVVTMDGASNPPVLDQVLGELQKLLAQAR